MKLLNIIHLITAVELIVAIGARAAPVATRHFSSQLLEELNRRKHSPTDKDAPFENAEKVNHRQIRSSNPYHDYVNTVFELRNLYWKPKKCNTTYNCESVSPHHCSGATSKFFCPEPEVEEISSGCKLNFNIYVDKGGKAEGVDLTMYKKTELNAAPGLMYYMFIMSKTRWSKFYESVSERVIESDCSGWQTFHMSENFVKALHQEHNNFTLIVASFKEVNGEDPQPMSCDEIKHTFFLDNRTEDFDFGMANTSHQTNPVSTDTQQQENTTECTTTTSKIELTTADPDGENNDEKDKTSNIELASAQADPDGENNDGKEKAAEPTSPKVTDNAKGTTDQVPSTLKPINTTYDTTTREEETQPTEMQFHPSKFLPIVTVFVVGGPSPITLPHSPTSATLHPAST